MPKVLVMWVKFLQKVHRNKSFRIVGWREPGGGSITMRCVESIVFFGFIYTKYIFTVISPYFIPFDICRLICLSLAGSCHED